MAAGGDIDSLSILASVAVAEIRSDVNATCNLMALKVDKSRSIEVFCDGQFFAASVLHKVGEKGFEVRFHISLETARVKRADFMKTWRFPFDAEKCELYMLLVPDDHV